MTHIKAFRIANVCFAIAILFSFIPYFGIRTNLVSSFFELGTVISALLLLLPSFHLKALPLLVLFYLLFFIEGLPEHPNHRYLLFFYALSLLPSALILLRGKFEKASEYYWNVTSRLVLYITLLLYFFAFFAKLNTTYLNPEFSCASLFMEHVYDLHIRGGVFESPSLLPFLRVFSIYSSIVCELLLIPLLFFTRTRYLGVILGLIFHFGLSLDFLKYFTNFSAVLFLILPITLGSSFVSRLFSDAFLARTHLRLFIPAFIFGCLFLFTRISPFSEHFAPYQVLLRGLVLGAWIIYSLCFIWFAIKAVRPFLKNKEPEGSESLERNKMSTRTISAIIIILVFLNGFSPYVGLKTRTAFSMYSNLWIDPFGSNHLVVRKSIDILSSLKDSAYIEQVSGDQTVACTAKILEGHYYPLRELGRLSPECGDESYFFSYGGVRYYSKSNEAENLFIEHSNWFSKTFLAFAPMGEGGARECIW